MLVKAASSPDGSKRVEIDQAGPESFGVILIEDGLWSSVTRCTTLETAEVEFDAKCLQNGI